MALRACGGVNLFAVVYAVWNETTGFLICTYLLSWFQRNADFPMSGKVARYSFAAFLVHRPVSEVVEVACDAWLAGAVTKTITLGSVNVLSSWAVGWGLAKVPGVEKTMG
jgi:hypothetical protein